MEASNLQQQRILIWRAALLRKLYPGGISAVRYEDALQKLEIAEQISQSVVATDIEHQRSVRPAPARVQEEPEAAVEEVSVGVTRLVDMLRSKPGKMTISAIMRELGYTKSYVYQLVGQARRAGYMIGTNAKRRYQIAETPMREAPHEPGEPVTQ